MPRDRKGRMSELHHQESLSTTLAEKVRALYNAYNQNEHDAARANLIATIEMDALSIAQGLDPEIIRSTIGEATLDAIRRTVQNVSNDMENKLEWIHFYLLEKETELRNEWTRQKAVQMQNLYMDDPKRAYRWLTNDTQPDIPISIQTLANHFSKIWEEKPEFHDPDINNFFKLHKVTSEEDLKSLKEDLLNPETMMDVIRTRGIASAPGEDGLTNPILKIQAESMAGLLVEMLSKLLDVKKCPAIWKSSRTILLFKKGDRTQPGNWRPISLTSAVYRVIMAPIAKWLFKLNARVPLVSSNQKGFISGIAGCSEHSSKANSVIHNAVSNNRPFFVVALDLKDAFGSIPHQLIKRNMEDIGLPEEINELIEDCYHKSTTPIFAGKDRSSYIKANKDVKQ
jgi:hypothetical protein